MNLPQTLTILAVVCLAAAAFSARRHLRVRRGLLLVFVGLLISGVMGIAITFSSSLVIARLLSLPMLAGMFLVTLGIHTEQKVPTWR